MTERRLAFGEVAEGYEAARPSYPAELVDGVLAFAGGPARALEVGAGTGKATELLARRGVAVHALEPSEAMARVARRRCAGLAGVRIEVSDFESFRVGLPRYSLVFAAQAWHWVAPEVRYVKARAVLEPGGTLALFWNRPRWEGVAVRDELRQVYARTVPDFGLDPGPMHPATDTAPELWGDWRREIAAAPGFAGATVRTYEHHVAYTTEAYTNLLRTHSDHIMLGQPRLDALLHGVAAALNRRGGGISMDYATQLCLARAV